MARVKTDPPGLRDPLLPGPESGKVLERLTIDDMLQKYCGEFGRWQLRHFVLTSLAWALEAFHTMVMIFADREPEFRCLTAGGSCGGGGVCGLESGSWEWVGGPSSSTVAEWGLVCGEKYKVGLVQAAFFGGCMIGAGTFGHLSDSTLGRKGSLTVVCTLNAILGCLTAFSPNYWAYLLIRLLTGFSSGGVGLCAFVLATEPVGPSKRGAAGMSTFYFFSTGIAILSGLAAYFATSWRTLYVASSIPSFLFLILVIPFISESPRWYLVRGRLDEAMSIMRSIARSNRRHLPECVILALDDDLANNNKAAEEEQHLHTVHQRLLQDYSAVDQTGVLNTLGTTTIAASGSLVDVIRSPVTRIRLILAVAISFSSAVVYYGLSLNVVNLETNLYVSVLVNAVAEMPSYTMTAVLLERFGRKPLAIGTQWFSGVFCLLGCVVSGEGDAWKVVKMVCGVFGIFGMAGTYNLLFIYAAELFPTVVRNAALGCATQASQFGAILAPFVVVMGGSGPFAVFAVCGLVGGSLAFFLPETLNQPLYDTMSGMADGGGKDGSRREAV